MMTTEAEWSTWDGLPISPEAPFGASIVVYRSRQQDIEFLILHRAHDGADFEGEWAWTPPSGARLPNEAIDECARRELLEETGLSLPLQAIGEGKEGWALYSAKASANHIVTLDGEHDRYEWVLLETALERCLPEKVGQGVRKVADNLQF
jgi:8-oxo-dGTP pyrophosphatase MutT (NUDIX family)